jgi:hypothetical protein
MNSEHDLSSLQPLLIGVATFALLEAYLFMFVVWTFVPIRQNDYAPLLAIFWCLVASPFVAPAAAIVAIASRAHKKAVLIAVGIAAAFFALWVVFLCLSANLQLRLPSAGEAAVRSPSPVVTAFLKHGDSIAWRRPVPTRVLNGLDRAELEACLARTRCGTKSMISLSCLSLRTSIFARLSQWPSSNIAFGSGWNVACGGA